MIVWITAISLFTDWKKLIYSFFYSLIDRKSLEGHNYSTELEASKGR